MRGGGSASSGGIPPVVIGLGLLVLVAMGWAGSLVLARKSARPVGKAKQSMRNWSTET